MDLFDERILAVLSEGKRSIDQSDLRKSDWPLLFFCLKKVGFCG